MFIPNLLYPEEVYKFFIFWWKTKIRAVYDPWKIEALTFVGSQSRPIRCGSPKTQRWMLLVGTGRKDATLHVFRRHRARCLSANNVGGGNSSTMNDDSCEQEVQVIRGRKVILLVTFSAIWHLVFVRADSLSAACGTYLNIFTILIRSNSTAETALLPVLVVRSNQLRVL